VDCSLFGPCRTTANVLDNFYPSPGTRREPILKFAQHDLKEFQGGKLRLKT
jgi:hypothetical protein